MAMAIVMATVGAARAEGEAAAAEAGGAEAGAYLAARAAGAAHDYAEASGLFARALAGDPADPWLLENALAAELAMGRLDAALVHADRLVEAGVASQPAHLVRAAAHAGLGDWRALLADLEAGRGAGPLIDGLSRAWARLGLGETEAALSAFDEVAQARGMRAFGLYHKALAMASIGDLAGAEAILALPESEGMQRTRRGVLAQAQVLSGLGRDDDAVAAIDAAFGRDLDAATASLRARLAAGEAVPFTQAETPLEGLAEVYFTVAAALTGEEDAETALAYARVALALDPMHADAALLAAARLEDLGQPALATMAYALVAESDPAFVAAETGRASVLRRQGEGEAAAEVLAGLARGHPDLPEVQAALGDQLRALDRLEEAEAAYDRAIGLYVEGDGGQADGSLWFAHYRRALARQARGDWTGAEADLRRALDLRPGQPAVLNHLGYSLVDRGEDLEEALGLIEEAVRLQPQNGAIVDSLGWALYRLGRFEAAARELERAATLEPTDAVVNDHLGDALWAVGRTREARFQWRRALSFEPEAETVERIRRKLDEGLDAVLAAEGAGAGASLVSDVPADEPPADVTPAEGAGAAGEQDG